MNTPGLGPNPGIMFLTPFLDSGNRGNDFRREFRIVTTCPFQDVWLWSDPVIISWDLDPEMISRKKKDEEIQWIPGTKNTPENQGFPVKKLFSSHHCKCACNNCQCPKNGQR